MTNVEAERRVESEAARFNRVVRCQKLVDIARAFQPETVDVSEADDGLYDIPLDWVDVQNPLQSEEEVTVRSVLSFATGTEDSEQSGKLYDRGAWKIALETMSPAGEPWTVGDITFFYKKDEPAVGPIITLDGDGYVIWDGEDTDHFLTLLETALMQPAQQIQ